MDGTLVAVAALHQGAPFQMTWLGDPTHWLRCGSKIRELKNQNSPCLYKCIYVLYLFII